MNLSSVHTEINLPDHQLLGRGKVRDIYEVGDQLLIITSDRISAFDYVLDSGIPNKGKILTQMSLFWFEHMADIVSHHLISHKVEEFPNDLHPYADVLSGRSMLVKKAKVFRFRMEGIPEFSICLWNLFTHRIIRIFPIN